MMEPQQPQRTRLQRRSSIGGVLRRSSPRSARAGVSDSSSDFKSTESCVKLDEMQRSLMDNSSHMDTSSMRRMRSSRRAPLTRNGRSHTFPVSSSCAQLAEMRTSLSRNSLHSAAIPSSSNTPKRNLSSRALSAFAKRSLSGSTSRLPQLSSSDSSSTSETTKQDPIFFAMIQYNPMDAEERAQYDDRAVKKYIRRHPEALRVKYDFSIGGGRGRLTVSRYPLSALVALGASLATVKLAIKAFPWALEPSKDFGSTSLHAACSFHTHVDVVRYIYNKYPAAIQATTKLVYLPLHNACQASSEKHPLLEVIQFLVEQYPEGLMSINKLGDTPLRMAQRHGCMPAEVLKFLQEETDRVFGLEENSETFKLVSERQSWGSKDLSMNKELLDQAVLSLAVEDEDMEEANQEQVIPRIIVAASSG